MTSGWRAHIKRIGGVLRALRERGQSETIGVALLTGIVLILVALVGLFLFADFGADDEEQLLANIDGDVEATNITLSHEGGDTFEPGEVNVQLTGDAERNYTLEDDFDAVEGGGDRFAPGDAWETSDSGLIIGDGRMLVIHQPSNTILLDQPYSIEEDGVDLAVEHHPTGNLRSDSATVHGNANWTYEISATLGGVSYEEGDDGIDYNISFDYQSGTDKDKINWYDDGNHEIEVGDIDNKKKVTANATIYREDGTPLNETGEVELTVKPEPIFSVEIVDAEVNPDGNALATDDVQFGTEDSLLDDPLIQGDTIEVIANVTNTNDEAAEMEQPIKMEMDMPGMSGQEDAVSLDGGESENVSFEMDIPDNAPTGTHTMNISSEDDYDTWDMSVDSEAFFEVDIVEINDPVALGDDLSATVNVTNTGTLSDTQDVNFELTTTSGNSLLGGREDSVSVPLDGKESTEETLSVSTGGIPGGEGLYEVNITTSGQGNDDTQVAVLLSFSVSFTSVSDDVFASNDDDVSVKAEVSHGLSNLGEQEVTTNVTIDPKQLGGSVYEETVSFTDSDSTSKPINTSFSPDYSTLNPTDSSWPDYEVTVSEDATGDTDKNDEVTVRKVVMDVSFISSSVPDEIDVGEDLTVSYTVSNTGNVDQDATVQLVENGSSADIVRDSDDYTDLNDETQNGGLTFSSSDIDSAGFGAGDTIGLTLKAVDGGSVLANAEESVDIAPLDDDDFDMTITNTNSPVNESEDVEITTEVVPTFDVLSGTVGTNAVLDDATLEVSLGELGTKSTTIDVLQGGTTETLTFSTGSGDAGTYTATATLLGIGANDTKQVKVEPQEPDLQFDYVNAPNQLTIGSTSDLTVDYSVTNVGNAEASATIGLSVDKTTGNEDTDALNVAPGDSASGTLTYSDFASDYNAGGTISWTVDIPGHGQETGTTSVAGDPANFDVTILNSDNPDAGNDLSVGVQVTNTGDKTGDVDVSLDIPGIGGSKTTTMQDVIGGGVRTHTFTFGTSSDDAGTHIATADTGDNTDTTQVTIEGANIQVASASGPAQISPGDDLNIDYTLENVGTKDGTEGFVDLKIEDSGSTYDDTDYDVTVPAGGTTSGTLTFSDTGGYSDGDTINWKVELYDFGDSDSGNTAVSGSGGGGGSASFAVNIQGTNSPVTEGDVLDVSVQIGNTGDASGTQTISLSTGGLGSDSTSVTLGSGSSTTQTLSVSTSSGDAGDYTATVSSADTSDSEGVTVTSGAAPSQFNVQIDSIAGQSFNPEVEVPAGGTTVDVDYTVENTGGKDGSTPVKVYRNGNNVGTGSETVPPGQTRSGSFSVSIGDNHISGNGINIEVTTSDDSDSDTVETKALRIVSHSVDSQVHPFLYENMTTVVENIGSATASDTLKITDYSGDYQSSMNIEVKYWQSPQEFHVGLDQSTAENMFGKSDSVNAELDTYADSESGDYVDFDIHGDVWLKQDYVEDLTMDDDSENPGLFDCAISFPPAITGCLDVDFTLEPGSSSDVVVPDGMSKSSINGGFRIYGEGSFLGDFPGSITDSTIVLEEGLGNNINYQNRVTEESIITDSDQTYFELAHILVDGSDVLEYEFPNIVLFPSNVYCGITGDFGSSDYETTKDKPFSNWASSNGWTDYHLTQYDENNDYQCDDLNSEGGFFGP
jgi:hypothetical protein